MIFDTSKRRLLQYLDIKDISKAQFYRDTQIKRGFLDADKLDSTISDIFLAIILDVYQDLNLSWLIAEKGTMIKSQQEIISNSTTIKHQNFMFVPLVHKRARAGFMSGWGDDEYIDNLPKIPWEVDREYKGKYLTFEAVGDSMESDDKENSRDSIYERDLLLCRNVRQDLWRYKLHINKYDFIVVHKTEGILTKRIIEHDENTGKLVLHSLNSYYKDQVVYMDDLNCIFNIVDSKRNKKRD